METFRELALKLTKLETRLNEDAIAVVMRKRFGIDWSKKETEMLHEGMKKALSEFISNEQNGWTQESVVGSSSSVVGENYERQTTNHELESGKPTENPTGSPSTTTSSNGAETPGSTT